VSRQTATADDALALIESKIAAGLTPVMAGTGFYRHSFQASQFGSYVHYLDERGTKGCFLPQNVEKCLDFVDRGRAVPAVEAVFSTVEPEAPGSILGIAVMEPSPKAVLSLLEAAVAALGALDEAGITGPARDGLAQAIKREGRVC